MDLENGTGVPHLQENALPWDPTVGLCLGSEGVPGGWLLSYGRGTLVQGVSKLQDTRLPKGGDHMSLGIGLRWEPRAVRILDFE